MNIGSVEGGKKETYVRAEMEFHGIVCIFCPICLKFGVEQLCTVSVSSCDLPSNSAQGRLKGITFRCVP